jgi:type IV pilus assembly protein PilW
MRTTALFALSRQTRCNRGFSLVELMVALVIGLVSTLAIVQVLAAAEGNRRGATGGSDAQVAGAVGLYSLQREIEMSGYGITSSQAAIGCQIQAQYGGAALATFPSTLAPVVVTPGAGGDPDTVQILSAASQSYAVPVRVTPPFYDPSGQESGGAAFTFRVASVLGVRKGDLMATVLAGQPCQVFQVSDDPTIGALPRGDTSGWNSSKFPSYAMVEGSFVVPLGTVEAKRFSIDDKGRLTMSQYDIAARDWSAAQEMQSNVVNMKVFYGKDTNGDGSVDTYDTVAPSNNGEWLQVRAVRLAVVTRSVQYEKEEVTLGTDGANDGQILWDVGPGKGASVTGAVDCLNNSKCIKVKVNFAGNDEWKHYRYKLIDSVVPLRNVVWSSERAPS